MDSWRSELEAAKCPCIDQIDDSELDAWLFQPGSDHLKLLQWGLAQLDSELQDHFQNVPDNNVEEEIIRLVTDLGLCHGKDSDVVLGKSNRKKQTLMWQRFFKLLRCKQRVDLDEHKESCYKELSALLDNSEFWALLETQVNLIPIELHLPPMKESVEEIEERINFAVNEGNNLGDEDSKATLHDDFMGESVPCEERKALIISQLHRVRDCYQHLAEKVFPLVKHRTLDPEAQQLGVLVEDVGGRLNAFVQLLSGRENIKKLAALLQMEERGPHASKTELYQYIGKTNALMTDILALVKKL